MSLRLNNLQEYEDLKRRITTAPAAPAAPPPGTNKYRNVICEADGIKFRSKKERARYLELCALQSVGECWFLRQVPFYLPGNTKYVLDFLVFWKDGRQTYEDSKGTRTTMFIMKKKQVEALYPIRILEL